MIAWAVIGKDGTVLAATVRASRGAAIDAFCKGSDVPWVKWKQAVGVRVAKVTVMEMADA